LQRGRIAEARLACFDRLTKQTTDADGRTRKTPPKLETTTLPSVRKDAVETDANPAESASESGNVAESDFGFSKTGTVRGVIVGLEQAPRGQYLITLDNGQVWRETEASRRSRYEEGDAVTIKKGMFASYRLRVDATGYTQAVRRVE